MTRALLSLAIACSLLSGAAPSVVAAQSAGAVAELGGVKMRKQVTVSGQELQLNGMALRKKAVFKVYVAGLYLPAREADAGRILAADQPRHLVMRFVRSVDREKICDAWNEGLAANTPDASAELKEQFVRLCGWMEDVEKGDQFAFTYLPGTGTRVEVKGRLKGAIPGKEFADALFKSWIGPKPGPGEGFKRDLLGAAS